MTAPITRALAEVESLVDHLCTRHCVHLLSSVGWEGTAVADPTASGCGTDFSTARHTSEPIRPAAPMTAMAICALAQISLVTAAPGVTADPAQVLVPTHRGKRSQCVSASQALLRPPARETSRLSPAVGLGLAPGAVGRQSTGGESEVQTVVQPLEPLFESQ